MNKSLTVIIPTIGRSVLDLTIESVLEQSLQPEELLLWDNSGDGSAKKNSKYANDSRIRWEASSERLPIIDSWNRAVDLARCDYVYILGDDDFLLPGFIAEIKTKLKNGAELINLPVQLIDMEGNPLKLKKTYLPERELTAAEYIKGYTDRKIDIFLGSLVFPKEVFYSINRFKSITSNAIAMDSLFHIEMACKSGKILVLGHPVWKYRTAVSDWAGRLKRKEDVPLFIDQMMQCRDYIRTFFTGELEPVWNLYYRRWLISPLVLVCYASDPAAALKLIFRKGFTMIERISIMRDIFYLIRHK